MTRATPHQQASLASVQGQDAADQAHGTDTYREGAPGGSLPRLYVAGDEATVAEIEADMEIETAKDIEAGVEIDTAVEIESGSASGLDGGWGWFIVAGSFLTHVLMGGFHQSNGVVYLQLRERYHGSATATSWVLALFSTTTLCMGPVVSALCNRFSIRAVVFLGGLLSCVGMIISAHSPNLWFLYFSHSLVAGFGRALVYCPCLIIVGYYFNKRRGLAVGLATSGGGVGRFLFPPLVERMFEVYGFTNTFIVLGAVVAHFLVSAALYRPLELHRRIVNHASGATLKTLRNGRENVATSCDPDTSLSEEQRLLQTHKPSTATTMAHGGQALPKRPSLIQRKFSEVKLAIKGLEGQKKDKKPLLELSLFRNYAFTAMCIHILLFSISFSGTIIFLPALVRSKGLTTLQGAYLVSIMGISDAIMRICGSVLLDLKRVKKFRLLIYALVQVALGVVSDVLPVVRTFGQLCAACAVFGAVSGTLVAQKSVVLVDILGVASLASGLGIVLLFQGLGSLLGPTIGGLFKDFLGSYEMSFYCGSAGVYLGALVQASGCVWMYIQRRKHRASQQPQ